MIWFALGFIAGAVVMAVLVIMATSVNVTNWWPE